MSKTKYKYPTCKSYLQDLADSVFTPCINNLDNIIIALPGDGHISMVKFLIDYRNNFTKPSKILKKVLGKEKTDNSVFIVLDLNKYSQNRLDDFYREINLQIENNSRAYTHLKRKLPKIDSYKDYYKKAVSSIRFLTNNEYELYFIFRYSNSFNEINDTILQEIFSIQSLYQDKIRLIFSFYRFDENNLPETVSKRLIAYKKTFLPNLSKDAVYYEVDKYFFENKKSKKVNDKVKDFIYNNSGGLGAPLKAIIIENLNKNFEDYSVPDSAKRYFQQLYKVLNKKEIELLKKIYNNESIDHKLREKNKFIFKTGLSNHKPLIKKVLELVKTTSKDIKHEKYMRKATKNKRFLNNLTATEYRIYQLLNKNKKHIVEREEIAKAIWKDKFRKKYSDWAIDRHIYKIRKKLPNNEKIETKKGRGYILHIKK